MKIKQTTNEKDYKEFLIQSGRYKGCYISYWKNQCQHIDLMENETTSFGESLYITKQKKELTTNEIKMIVKAILTYKTIKGEQ